MLRRCLNAKERKAKNGDKKGYMSWKGNAASNLK